MKPNHLFSCVKPFANVSVIFVQLWMNDIVTVKAVLFFSIYWQTFFSPLVTVLARVKLSFTDTVIRFEHLPKDTVTGIGLEIHIKRYKHIAHFGIVMDEVYIVSVVVDSLKYF